MSTTTISSKYTVVIPKDVREKLHLKSGQKMTVVTKGGLICLIPERSLVSLKGFIKGMPNSGLREEQS